MREAAPDSGGVAATDPERYKASKKVTWIGVATNLLLALVKGVFGVLAHSQALVADALHSLSDLLTDALVLAAVRMGAQESDTDHPYGHGRFETLGTVVLGLILIGAGLGIAINAAVRLAAGEIPLPTWPALVAAAFSIGANEWLFRVQVHIGRKYRASSIIANAWHHRTDALSSLAALAGIAGSLMGWIVLDTVAAMAVALMVVWAGGKLGWEAVRELVDTALDEQEVDRIQRQILRIEGVQSVHNLKTRRMGPEALVDVHIQVPGTISVSEGHQIAERVRRHLIDSHPEVSEVLVHVDPEDDEQGIPLLAQRGEVMAEVFRCIQALDRNLAVRDYTVHYLNGEITLDLAIEVDPSLDLESAYAEAEAVRQTIRANTEASDSQVNLYVPHSETQARTGGAVAH
ncbi:cation diffusion facilitator family transporter [Thiohalorhabdus sp.]|uniref:cation diffusion facilitator family transporter n=1 Tax=Thiohalorhabdus sp. TaxID=3094134 RepID=UPI002FC394C8